MALSINDGQKTLAVTSSKVIEEVRTGQRRVLIITNTSTGGESLSLGIGQEAVLNKGITLAAGATYATSSDSSYNPPNYRVNAIGSAATATLSFHEEILI